ncbi:MAG TPA: rod shape-determining protein MreC [Opitutaceae bacterium]|nr:rod shape-determining protein MreC [Opitutaceae bacterium]HND60202.1 rod shape-determining protein MreC [Opitutaceae bacterium]
MPKRFDQARPFLTLALVALGWLLVPVAVKTFTRASFFELQAPLTVAASYARDLQDYWTLRLHSNSELIDAGRDLARLNASYEEAVQQNLSLQAEIARLEELLKLPAYANYRSEHARVVRRDFSGWWQRLVIRKGRNFGVTVGAPVIFAGGVVGRVSEVYAYTATVELISDPSVRLAAVVEGENQPISFQGGVNTSFDAPKGVIEFVPLSVYASPTMPKRLVTSGLGGVFPPGLNLGTIIKVEPSLDGLYKTGEVQLDPRLSALTEVTVLVPLNEQ